MYDNRKRVLINENEKTSYQNKNFYKIKDLLKVINKNFNIKITVRRNNHGSER